MHVLYSKEQNCPKGIWALTAICPKLDLRFVRSCALFSFRLRSAFTYGLLVYRACPAVLPLAYT